MRAIRTKTTMAVALALALTATACGGDGGGDATTETEPDAGAETDAGTETTGGAETGAAAGGNDCGAPEGHPLAGEDITLTVGVGPGGGYDAYVRLIAPYLEEAWGATVVVNNEPGAGGLVALNNLLGSDADGTQAMLINGVGVAGSYLAGAEGVNFELDELGYVGRVYAGAKLIGAGVDTGYETWEDVQSSSEPFVFGASGPGASTYVEPTVLMEILEEEYDIITGFDGSADIQTAMVAGEVDGISLDEDSILPAVEAGDANALLLMGAEERSDAVPDVPILTELDLTEQQMASAQALEALIAYGRTMVVHPDTDPEVIELWRTTLECVLKTEGLLADAEAQGRPIGWLSGADVEGQVETILNAPERFREIVSLGYE